MTLALNEFYDSNKLLPTMRDFLSRHPEAAACGAEELAAMLRAGRLMPRRVSAHEVEAVLEALVVEDGVLA